MRYSRKCPVCSGKEKELVFNNKMAALGRFDLSYDVVMCSECSFAFADNTIDEKSLDDYYSSYSKYDVVRTAEAIPIHTRQSAANCASIVSSFIPAEACVIDIGSSIGIFLNELRQRGFSKLYGIDPAPACSEIARELFDVRVDCCFLTSEVDLSGYELVTLSNVLEHISDVGSFLDIISSSMKKGAHLFIEVPAGDMFYREATEYMGEFSIEHINYFGLQSLQRLLAKHGFHKVHDSYATYAKGIITINLLSVFDGKKEANGQCDSNLRESVSSYIESNRSIVDKINRILGEIGENIVIYGAGSHTARLLKQSDLQMKEIVAVVDKNPNLIGKEIGGVLIENTTEFDYPQDIPVLISSYNYQEEIRKVLIKNRFNGQIITVY